MKILFPQILFQIINFSIVMGALWYLLYKPVIKIFATRAKRIEEGQKAAQEAITQQEKIEEMKEKAQYKLQQKSAAEMKKVVAEAEKQKLSIIAQAQREAASEIAKMKENWELEKSEQARQVNQQLIEAVIATTQKVIGVKLDDKSHRQLIDQELNNILKSI